MSNALTALLIINNELVRALKPLLNAQGAVRDSHAAVSAFFGLINLNANDAALMTEKLTWTIFIVTILSIVFTVTSYQLYRNKKDFVSLIWSGVSFTPEQASIQVGMLLLKAVVQVIQPNRPTHVFLYVFGYMAQLLAYEYILRRHEDENEERIKKAKRPEDIKESPKVRMLIITLYVYFTMQQYFYRTSHRERFSSLQFGKVCPGRGLCKDEIEWPLMLLDIFGPHILGFLFLPMFTLNFKEEMSRTAVNKIKAKKFLEEEEIELQESEDKKEDDALKPKKRKGVKDSAPEAMYDADHDDLGSSDIGEHERKIMKEKNTTTY